MILVHVEWFVIGSKTDLERRQNDKYMKTQKNHVLDGFKFTQIYYTKCLFVK